MEVIRMLYLGIDLSDFRVTITALSEGFAFLDELSFLSTDCAEVGPWLDSLLLGDDEPVSWFFCEKKFLTWNGPFFFFEFAGDTHRFFLVKDRVIENLYKMCCDYFSRHGRLMDFERSYLLAAARGFVDEVYISPCIVSLKQMKC